MEQKKELDLMYIGIHNGTYLAGGIDFHGGIEGQEQIYIVKESILVNGQLNELEIKILNMHNRVSNNTDENTALDRQRGRDYIDAKLDGRTRDLKIYKKDLKHLSYASDASNAANKRLDELNNHELRFGDDPIIP